MTDFIDNIAALVKLNGGQVVGKTRLQKIVYLLEAKQLGFGFDYDYHNYGPFCAELAFAADDAVSLGFLRAENKPGRYHARYTVFHTTQQTPEFDDPCNGARQRMLEAMQGTSSLILELAATAVYLKENGYRDDYWAEVVRRKPLKATPERIEQATKLLTKLQLLPS